MASCSGVRGVGGPVLVVGGVVAVTVLDGPSPADQVRALVSLVAVVAGMALVLRDLAVERRGVWLGAGDRRRWRWRWRWRVDVRTAVGAVVICGALLRLLSNGASLAAETSAVIAALILFSGGVLNKRLLGGQAIEGEAVEVE